MKEIIDKIWAALVCDSLDPRTARAHCTFDELRDAIVKALNKSSFQGDPIDYTSKFSVYKSQTHGSIRMTEKARGLMHRLRIAIECAIRRNDYSADECFVARTRGELAQHISQLERDNARLLDEVKQAQRNADTARQSEKDRADQADAWEAVYNALRSYAPEHLNGALCGRDSALSAIRRMAGRIAELEKRIWPNVAVTGSSEPVKDAQPACGGYPLTEEQFNALVAYVAARAYASREWRNEVSARESMRSYYRAREVLTGVKE